MVYYNKNSHKINQPYYLFEAENNGDGVDKGTSRKTPGTGKGAHPPQEEDYPDDDESKTKKKTQKHKKKE